MPELSPSSPTVVWLCDFRDAATEIANAGLVTAVGGALRGDKTLVKAAIRELREELAVNVVRPIRGSVHVDRTEENVNCTGFYVGCDVFRVLLSRFT